MSHSIRIPKRQLGKDGPLVSAIGLGRMGFGDFYGPRKGGTQDVLNYAADRGMTFWDCADIYGVAEDELGKWFQTTGRRDEIFLATKFGAWDLEVPPPNSNSCPISKPSYIRRALMRSLTRLQTESIDLYYQSRTDPKVPIEIVLETLREFIDGSQIKWIGLCECSIDTLKRAKAVKGVGERIIAVQMEFSPFELSLEINGFFEEATALGVGVVAYSPLGRGLLSGRFRSRADFAPNDLRLLLPRYSEDNFSKNWELVDKFELIAAKRNGVTPSQVILAWILAEHRTFIPIPGCRAVERVEENASAAELQLSSEEVQSVRDFVEAADVRGARYPPAILKSCEIDCLPLTDWKGEESEKNMQDMHDN